MASVYYVIEYPCGCQARRFDEDDHREIDFCAAHHHLTQPSIYTRKTKPTVDDGAELEPR